MKRLTLSFCPGIVARTYGTCVLLERHNPMEEKLGLRKLQSATPTDSEAESGIRPYSSERQLMESKRDEPHSSMPHQLSGSLFVMSEAAAAAARHREGRQDEVQLLTLREFGPSVRVRIGGLVTARCVKYLGNLASKLSDQETRDSWWSELRDEIRAHAKILCCSHVVGYLEASTIHDDVCVLSITGTAATVRGLPDLTESSSLFNTLNFNEQFNDDGDQSGDDMHAAIKPRKKTRKGYSERLTRRMRRAQGKASSTNNSDDSAIASKTNNKQLSEYIRHKHRGGAGNNIIRSRRAKPCVCKSIVSSSD